MDVHPAIRHEPDPEHPGWWCWDISEVDRFNGIVGRLLVRPDGPGRATLRMFPEHRHSNFSDMVHGGVILTFIDMALFAAGRVAGADTMYAVTLDCSARFLSPGRIGLPLDAETELIKETRRLAFFAGKIVQEGELVADFSGTLRKSARASSPERGGGPREARWRGPGDRTDNSSPERGGAERSGGPVGRAAGGGWRGLAARPGAP